jgi:hypothetical protein
VRPGAAGEVPNVEPGVAALQRSRSVELDLNAQRPLSNDVVRERRVTRVRRQVEVGPFHEPDVDGRVVDRELGGGRTQELDAELRAAHVHGDENCCRIELADNAVAACA